MLRMNAGFKAIALCFCFLALAACSKKNTVNLEDENGLGRAAVAGSEQQFKTEVGDTVFYLVDQSTLTPEGQETLRRQATWLKQYSDVMIQVEGHADERGTREYNIALSARRATTTRQFLISQGIEASRISSIAYGKERPAALCDAEQCYSQNRRTVTVITSGAKTS
jgi:peptidoglycan-associated lipoprotein